MLTIRNFIVGALAAIAVAAGIAAFAGLNLGGGGVNDVDIAEAHGARYLAGFNIPAYNDVTPTQPWHSDPYNNPLRVTFRFRNPQNPELFLAGRYDVNDDDGSSTERGCEVSVPIGLILVPAEATTVTIPAGHDFAVAEADNCGLRQDQGRTAYQGDVLYDVSSYTVTIAYADDKVKFHNSHSHTEGDPNYVADGHPDGGVATGVTGTGFYCGRHYAWRDLEPDAEFPMFMTAARRSLIGWVYVDSSGHQVARCTGYRSIYRPADLYEGGAPQ